MKKEIEDINQKKKNEIANLKKNIEEMSHQFATMLKDTLEKMKNKIDSANSKWEEENDGQMMQRFSESVNK